MTRTEVTDESKCCCSCRNNVRTHDKEWGCVCNCDKDGHYIGYVENFTQVCEEWETMSDYIERQAAIDAAALSAAEWDGMYVQDINGRIREALEKLPSVQPEQRWIPCSEELPKENGHYLVTFHQTATEEDLGFDMDNTDVRKMRYDTKHGWRTPRHVPSWINNAVVSTVLAWMPLPKPYREERTEE